jgi:hypothetical protein
MIPIRERKEHMLFNRIPVMIQSKPTYDVGEVIKAVQQSIPQALVSDLDYIIISDSEHLKQRDLDSVYLDGVIYLSGDIDGNKEAILTVVHEIAHSTEELFPQIYEDESIEAEFLGKRTKLYQILASHNVEMAGLDFLNAEYSENFDDFLYLVVGYPLLRNLSSGLFLSPYAITSIREYFADAFEEYFMRDPKGVKLVSPAVYFKIEQLLENLGERYI